MGDKKPETTVPIADQDHRPNPKPRPEGWLTPRRFGMALTGVALVLLSLAAIHPLMFGSLPRTDDALQHLHRLIALDYSIRHGDLWPRYLPTMLYGYGEPLFNYYSPLSLYPFELLRLFGLSFQHALLGGLIGYVLLGTTGAYLLGRSWGGPLAGIGAAACYTYAPYLIYNILGRGAVGEVAALALLPWVLWAFRRLAVRGHKADFGLALGLTALMILTHNISALQTGALMAVYGLFVWWTGPRPPRFLVQMALAGVLAAGLTAFYWLPALGETDYVQLDRTRVGVQNPPDAPEFYDTFQTLGQDFELPRAADLSWFNPPVQRTLGWPQIVLAIAGLVFIILQRDKNPQTRVLLGLMILLAILVAVMVFMTTAASAWVWATVPLIRFFQFPWRLLGPASLLLALMAGISLSQIASRIPAAVLRGVAVGAAAAVVLFYALPGLYHLYIPDPAASSVLDTQNYERQTGQLGGTARGEFVPVWSQELPDADRLAPLYEKDEVIPRLQHNPAITVTRASWGPTSGSVLVSAPEETRLVFDWLFFPGWWATVDGQFVSINPTPKRGLISLNVPAGEHLVALGISPTSLQLGALFASGVCLVLSILLVGAVKQLWIPAPRDPQAASSLGWSGLLPALGAAMLVGLAVFLLKGLLIDNIQSPFKHERFAGGLETGLQHPLRLDYGTQVTLLGLDLASGQAASGQSIHPVFYWQPTTDVIPEDYTSSLVLRDASGGILAETSEFYPGGWATTNWVPGFYVRQPLEITIPAGTPPGTYSLSMSLFAARTQQNLPAASPEGAPLGIQPTVFTLEISRPSAAPSLESMGVGVDSSLPKLEASLIPDITLVSLSPPPSGVTVGDKVAVTAIWRAEAQPSQPYAYSLLWLNQNGLVSAVSTPAPLTPGFAADQWQPGDVWRGVGHFYVPGPLSAGFYDLAIQLFDLSGNSIGAHVPVGRVSVSTPSRTYNPPRRQVMSDVSWGNGTALIGYDLPQRTVLRSGVLPITLYWLPRSEVNSNLLLFVHLVDSNGNIVGQVDTVPAHGTRPTTGWAPGEVITDAIEITVRPDAPQGRYYLRIGWYDPETGERVPVMSGDFFLMPEIVRVLSGE